MGGTCSIVRPSVERYNRRGFFAGAQRLVARQVKSLEPVSVLMFDLDHFKSINDRFGHAIGDEALRAFAATAICSLRASDVVARYGGEEFVAILPGSLSEAKIAAERVRTAFEAAASTIAGRPVAATVSVGAASQDDINCDLGALFHRADGALYAAKSNGRNRVELIAPHEAMCFDDADAARLAALDRRDGQEFPALEKWGRTRRYRQFSSQADITVRQRRGGSALS